MKKIFTLLIIFSCASSYAGSFYVSGATVDYIGTYSSGGVYIMLSKPPAGCSTGRFDLPPSHPALRATYATALLAKSMRAPVVFSTNVCGQYPTTGDVYFFIL